MSMFVFALVISVMALTAVMISQHIVVNVLPSSMQLVKAIKHKSRIQADPLTQANSDNTGSASDTSPSSTPPSVTSPTSSCISYDPSTRTISVSCNSARLTDIDNKLHDSSVLVKQSPNGVWFLSANLLIAKGAVFHVDPQIPSG